MFGTYRELFQLPGTKAFSLTGFIARSPISQIGIATLLLVSAKTGSYTLAGQISGTVTLAAAIVMPQIARQVDRRGQAKVARPVIIVGTIAWLLLALAVTLDWPTWSWFVFAAIGGGSAPGTGAMVRARWRHVLKRGALMQRAFSWESALDEVIFVVGPVLATFLATSVAPWAGVVVATGLMLVGGWLFTGQRSTEPPPKPKTDGPSQSLLSPALVVVASVFASAGVLFGSVDVIVVAFAEEQGHKSVAGLILAAYAFGSLLAGLTFGVLQFKRSVGAQFVAAAVMCGVLAPMMLLANSLWLLAILVFVAGVAVAPLLISATMLVEKIVPPDSLTEGLTWTTTSLVIGVTGGAAFGGMLVDEVGARPALWLPAGAAILTGLVALAFSPRLRTGALPNRIEEQLDEPDTPVTPAGQA